MTDYPAVSNDAGHLLDCTQVPTLNKISLAHHIRKLHDNTKDPMMKSALLGVAKSTKPPVRRPGINIKILAEITDKLWSSE